MTQPDDQPNPRTLRVPRAPGIGADPVGYDKSGQNEIIGYRRDRFYEALRSQPGKTREGSDGPEYWVPKSSGTKSANGLMTIGDDGDTGPTEADGKWVQFDNNAPVMQLWHQWKDEESDLKLGEFVGSSGAGAGRSYLEYEEDKQDEVTRQFKDFLARAKGTYDLMDSEQDYGMSIDDQNIQNQEAIRKGYLDPGMTSYYYHSLGKPLSSIIRPSLPNYLSPDYRMNQAVGLPGDEGFNDPDYDETGMPAYAGGTDPALAMIPPELLAMIGKEPPGVPYPPLPPGSPPWKWGYVV